MRKNQLFLVACFVSVSFFALSSFIDSKAWGEATKCEEIYERQTYSTPCLLLKDLYFKSSYGYTNTTTNSEINGNPSLGAEISDTEIYSIGIAYSNKKIFSQMLIEKKANWEENDWRGREWKRRLWYFIVDPLELNASINFNRQFKFENQTLNRDLTDKTTYKIEIVYKLPIENIYWKAK